MWLKKSPPLNKGGLFDYMIIYLSRHNSWQPKNELWEDEY
jgi:hypothetical protein